MEGGFVAISLGCTLTGLGFDLLMAVDRGKCAFLVLLDLSAAFDTVDHETLLAFLQDYVGLSGNVLQILKSYLTDRTQCVSIKNVLSYLSELLYGVPQGSVLGPLIFCLYTLPLGTIIRHHKLSYHVYADDTQIYLFFDINSCDAAITAVTECIKDIRSWMVRNKLKINDEKTEFLVISSPYMKFNMDCSLKIGDITVQPSDSCKNLGVIMTNHLTMEKHIVNVCKNMLFYIRKIGAIRHLLNETATTQLVHALVTSRLDYCNSLLYGLPDTLIKRLQRVQNIAARIVTRCPKSCHMTPVLYDLHWLPVRSRILFKILLLTYRCLNGLAPAYLVDLITPYTPGRTLRSSNKLLITVPKTRLKTIGQRSFTFAAAHEWNELSMDVKTAQSIDSFKAALKKHLFELAF